MDGGALPCDVPPRREEARVAGEPELLSGNEPLAEHIARHAYDRLIMLCDGVFAIAITLLALELRPPQAWDGDLSHLVAAMGRPLFAYLFGFAVVGAFWIAHRALFARIRRVSGPFTLLALLQLCLIAATPAVAQLVATAGPAKAIKVYFMLIVALGTVQALLWAYAAFVGGLADQSLSGAQKRLLLLQLSIPPAMFLALLIANLAGAYDNAALPVVILGVVAVALLRRRTRKMAQG
jgi:uncharacterized membrane protein